MKCTLENTKQCVFKYKYDHKQEVFKVRLSETDFSFSFYSNQSQPEEKNIMLCYVLLCYVVFTSDVAFLLHRLQRGPLHEELHQLGPNPLLVRVSCTAGGVCDGRLGGWKNKC